MKNKVFAIVVFMFLPNGCSHDDMNAYFATPTYEEVAEYAECELENVAYCTPEILEYTTENDPVILNMEWVIANNRDISDAVLIPGPGGFWATFEQQFFKNYVFEMGAWYDGRDTIGGLITFFCCFVINCDCGDVLTSPNAGGQGSDRHIFRITENFDERLIVHSLSHDGWPGLISEGVTDANSVIDVVIYPENFVVLWDADGILSQLPEAQTDGFFGNGRQHNVGHFFIAYDERAESSLWKWLMNPGNAGWLNVVNPEPETISVSVRETTGDLWSHWGIQAFEWGGDTTLVSRRGVLSQIPELHDDILYFQLVTQGDFEVQYIMFHEREGSKLWQILGKYIAPLTISYSCLEQSIVQ